MDFAYTPELAELQDRARGLAEVIGAYENRCEEGNGLPAADLDAIADAVRDARLGAINMPVEWGGQGLSILAQVVVQEQLGRLTERAVGHGLASGQRLARLRRRAARALSAALHSGATGAIASPSPRRARAATRCAIATVAKRDPAGGGWIISGEKWFVTVGDVADVLITLAMADGAPTLFLVDKDTPGLRLKRVPRYMHTFVYEHPEFVFDGVRVSDDQVLGEVGQGYELTRDWFVEERLMIGARTIGAAERGAGTGPRLGQRARAVRPADRRLPAHPAAMLADCAVDIATNRALVHQVAWEADHGLDRKTLHAKAAMVKLAASEAAGRVIDRCVQIFGGRGYMRDYPVERLYRELRVDRIWEGTSEIQRLTIANEMTKRGPAGLLHVLRHESIQG